MLPVAGGVYARASGFRWGGSWVVPGKTNKMGSVKGLGQRSRRGWHSPQAREVKPGIRVNGARPVSRDLGRKDFDAGDAGYLAPFLRSLFLRPAPPRSTSPWR